MNGIPMLILSVGSIIAVLFFTSHTYMEIPVLVLMWAEMQIV